MVQPQAEIAALLAPEPVLIAPGEILIGARVEAELAESATEMPATTDPAEADAPRAPDQPKDVPMTDADDQYGLF